MNRKRLLPVALVLILLLSVAFAVHRGVRFDFRSFVQQLRFVDPVHVAIGLLLIYGGTVLRAYRWAVFMRAHGKVKPLSLVGSQFMGFTAVALFGRIADLSRPYLIAQKTGTPVAMQVAIYTVERMFDLGSAALIFSAALVLMPHDMPHHDIFVKVGVGSLAGTLFLAVFCISMRVAGNAIAAQARRMAGAISPALGITLEEKLLAFRNGLKAVSTLSDFVLATVLSLVMWMSIAITYVQVAHAFAATPSLATLPFPRAMLLMAASLGSSLVQLPVIGWFTQIAATAAAMHGFYGTPLEPATACGALLLIVLNLGLIPIGLIYARVDRVRLGDLARAEKAAEATTP